MSNISVTVDQVRADDGLITRRSAPAIEDFETRAPEVADSINEIARAIQSRLDASVEAAPAGAWAMDSISMSFELALEAQAGVVIAKATAAATFTIEISWRRSS